MSWTVLPSFFKVLVMRPLERSAQLDAPRLRVGEHGEPVDERL
jgi:hypothetical protein